MPLTIERLNKILYGDECYPVEADEMAQEIIEKREQLRWRRYPDEKPSEDGYYEVVSFVNVRVKRYFGYYNSVIDAWLDEVGDALYWKPTIPIPEGDK